MYLKPILSFAAVCALSMPSYAADVLTSSDIESFYHQSAEVQMLGEGVTLEFMQEHFHDDAKTVMHITTNMKGMTSQKETRTFDKESLLQAIKKSYEIGEVKKVESNVIFVDIAADGKSAKVKSNSYSLVLMGVTGPQGKVYLLIDQTMFCDDDVVLSSGNVIQAMGSECSVEVNVKQPTN